MQKQGTWRKPYALPVSLFTRAAPKVIAVEAPHKTRLDQPSSNPSMPCYIVVLQEQPQGHLHTCVCRCISHNSKGTEASLPMEMRRKQIWKADTLEFYSARKKNEVMSFTWMELHQVKAK